MAPKRSSGATSPKRGGSPKRGPAKKARTKAPEASLLDFLGKCDEIPKPCREMLQTALPFCLEVVEADRHKFQVEICERVGGLLSSTESKKKEALATVEAELAEMETEKGTAGSDTEAKKGASEAKKSECDEKGKVVDEFRARSDTAKAALSEAQKAEEEFKKKEAELQAEQESFAKLLADIFQPLKEGQVKQWQLRNKQIVELTKKLKSLGAQESLADALAATLKMTPEKRAGTFAQATLKFTEEVFNKHTAQVAADIAGLSAEAEKHKSTIASAQAELDEKNAALKTIEGEWDAMQDVWISLEEEHAKASRSLSQIEARIPKVTKNIDKAKADLEKFLELPALFSKLKEHSTTAAPEPEEVAEEAAEDAAEAAAEGEGEKPDEEMQA